MIGIDYAVARGQAWDQGDAGVGATISTGMIGQGVVNFGRLIGPAFAALLISLWAAMLARLDLEGHKLGRMPLLALGLILTFTMGRDITLILLYTFIFGSVLVWWLERSSRKPERGRKRRARSWEQEAGDESKEVQETHAGGQLSVANSPLSAEAKSGILNGESGGLKAESDQKSVVRSK